MKHPSNLVPGIFPADHMPCEESPDDLLTPLPVAARHPTHLQQELAQLLARYRRAGYEVVEHWNIDLSVTK